MKKTTPRAQDVLIEIGTEELPATNLADFFESEENPLLARFRKSLEEKRLSYTACRVWATPRRLVFFAEGVPAQQAPKEDRVKLLSHGEAFAADGKPTEKLLMILKHRQAQIEDLVTEDLNGKPTVFIKKSDPARKTTVVLPELVETLVKTQPFPKSMRWNESGANFPRPIRSLLCFYGAQSLEFKCAGLRASGETRFFSKGTRQVQRMKDIPTYFSALAKRGVILDPSERKKKIAVILEQLARSADGKIYDDPFLLNEVNFLVEAPAGLWAPFDREFLNLPLEVLTVSMARKQRIFGVTGRDGRVEPRFLAILDGAAKPKEQKQISTNYENILRAKLQDSLFFYREDLKIPLERKREELKGLIFMKNAGSMLEKSERLVRLAKKAGEWLNLDAAERTALERAAFLSKSDLLTHMVGEFPELQGVIGRYYAAENGESDRAARAIGEQYLPRTATDRLPQTREGAVLSVLDKCDLITACFGLGLEPTSSVDPYGLRRSATAVLKILTDQGLRLPLPELLAACRSLLGSYVQKDKEAALASRLEAFFQDRFTALMVDRGFSAELVQAAVSVDFKDPAEAGSRVKALSAFSSSASFGQAKKVIERTVNILKGNREALPDRIDPGLFAEDLERRVYERFEAFSERIHRATQNRDFEGATGLYAEAFFAILGEFFEKVFVNCEDLKVRKNRLALLKAVKDLYTAKIADLSKIRPS